MPEKTGCVHHEKSICSSHRPKRSKDRDRNDPFGKAEMIEEEQEEDTEGSRSSQPEFPMTTTDFLSSLDQDEPEPIIDPFQSSLYGSQKDEKKEKFWFVQMYSNNSKEAIKKPLKMRLNEEDQDKIQLSVDRCFGINVETGTRCSSFTCLIHPYCMECTKKYYKVQVFVEQDNLFRLYCFDPPDPNTLNLDVDPCFSAGSRIAPLFGEILHKNTVVQRYFDFRDRDVTVNHLFHLDGCDYFVDPIRYRGPGFYARKSSKNNAVIEDIEDHLWLIATKPIHHGDEITVQLDKVLFKMENPKPLLSHKKSQSMEDPKHSKSSVLVLLKHVPIS